MYSNSYPMIPPMMGYGGMFGGGAGESPIMRWLYVINSSLYSIGQLGSLLAMSAHTFYAAIHGLRELHGRIHQILSQSNTLAWVRSKTKKSKILRWLIIFLSMYITSKVYEILNKLISLEIKNRALRMSGRSLLDYSNSSVEHDNIGSSTSTVQQEGFV